MSKECPKCGKKYERRETASRLGVTINLDEYSKSCLVQRKVDSRAMKATKDYKTVLYLH